MEHAVVIAERSGGVALFRRSAGAWDRTPVVDHGKWPTWNPIYDLLAISRVDPSSEGGTSAVDLVTLEGQLLRTLHESAPGIAPVIAPRLPHYALWSPGGDMLSYVAQSSYGLTLFLSHAEGRFVSDPIINGAPLFIAWCTDNNFLGVHAGDELAVVETEGSRTTANVAHRALGFRTPAFSDDANIMAYAIPAEPGVAIMRALFQGMNGREVHRFGGGVALGFRPGTEQLTVAVTFRPDSGVFDELWSLDLALDPPPATRLARGPFVSFFWAPTGDHIALVIPAQSGDGRYAIQALSPDGRVTAMTEAIVPSQDYRMVLGFFDQYMQSHHLWSPDGLHFLITGRKASDAVSGSFGDPEGDYVMLWSPAERRSPEIVAPGDIGFFRPLAKTVR
jgi:hypothetical protein